MPIIMFNQDDIVVIFDNTFVADQHENWFNMKTWTRVSVDPKMPTIVKYDPRGESYFAKFKDATIPAFITKDL